MLAVIVVAAAVVIVKMSTKQTMYWTGITFHDEMCTKTKMRRKNPL